MTHPMQPLAPDAHGVLRFKENTIVRFLVDWGRSRGMGLNELAAKDFPDEDWQQLAQLIGYSLSGYGDLSYVSDEVYGTAARMAEDGMSEDKARIATLQAELALLHSAAAALKEPVATLLRLHPDDLESSRG